MKTLFLPGASGHASFWKPAATHAGVDGVFFAWPGLGCEPPDAGVNGISDLVAMVLAHMDEPVNIVAQSMGGVVAMLAALARPTMVHRLVLAATSGGIPVADLGGSEWRANYRHRFPAAASWIADPVPDLSSRLPAIAAPTLLLWGDRDPISPVAVGERLAALLPDAMLHVLRGADHDLAQDRAEQVGGLIATHLAPEDSLPAPNRMRREDPKSIKGSCLCGAVSFEIDGKIGPAGQCHCSKCRKRSGTDGNAVFYAAVRSFRWLSGEDNIASFTVPDGKGWTSRFCRTCGSPTPHTDPDNKIYFVPAGLLDDDPGFRGYAAHIFVGSKAPWVRITDGAPQYVEGFGSPMARD